jgi:N6-adenosine-specific RNA methylase IME4
MTTTAITTTTTTAAPPTIKMVKISDIKIGNRLRKKATDIESLAASIENIGLINAIVIDENNNLITGYRRIKAFEYLSRTEIPCIHVNFNNPVKAEYDENVERTEFALEDIAEIYKLVKASRIGHRPPKKTTTTIEEQEQEENKVGKIPTFPKGPSDIVTGKIVGLSDKTVNDIVDLVEGAKDNPVAAELVEKVNNKETSLAYASKSWKRMQDNKKERPPLPEGQFDCILADPAWSYNINTRGSPDEHYAVMEDEEIMNLNIPAAPNAVLFLWATAPKLKEALAVMESWGFQYKTHAVWAKNHIGTGYWFRGQTEDLLVGVKGKGIGVPEEKDRHSSLIIADISKHSVKPAVVYEIIENMHPRRSYLELFARGAARTGWKSWGLEATTNSSDVENQEEGD